MKEKNLYMMISDIRYELSPGIHTFGKCSKCASNDIGARGGGVCIRCREKELAELVGDDLAYAFINITKSTNGIVEMMEKQARENNNRSAS